VDYGEVELYSSKYMNTSKVLTERWTQRRITLCEAKDYINNWVTVDNIMEGFIYDFNEDRPMTELIQQKIKDGFIDIINSMRDQLFEEYKRYMHEDNYQSPEDLKWFGLGREDDMDEGVNLWLEAVVYKDGTVECHYLEMAHDFDARYLTSDSDTDEFTTYLSMV